MTPRLAVVPLALLLAGCPIEDDSFGCTREFAVVRLPVVDERGAPVVPTAATVTRANGASLVCPTSDNRYRPDCVVPLDTSRYAARAAVEVAHDAMTFRGRDALRVTATDGRRSGAADVVVGSDGCHVRRLDGAAEIVLR